MSTRTFTRLAALAVLVVAAPAARADFALVSQDLSINRQAGSATFSLTFNQQPNFYTTDAAGRPANSFQVEFDGTYDPALPSYYPTSLTAVVRGDEIHVGSGVTVRSPAGNGGDNSGGWGPVLSSVPFTTVGNTVTFTTPMADLGTANGNPYQYAVFSLEYGSLTAERVVTSIPTPAAFAGGLVGLGIVALVTRRRGRGPVAA